MKLWPVCQLSMKPEAIKLETMRQESVRQAALLSLLVSIFFSTNADAFPWNKDMVDQPSVKPQETLVKPPPPTSVPLQGREIVPITQDIAEMFQGRVAAAKLRNPIVADKTSIAKGRALFKMVCQVCHGKTGAGDGPVGKKFIARPFDLTIDYVQQKPDGELFFTITNGSVVMPFYRDALTPQERWHLVNFLKRGLTQIETRPASLNHDQGEPSASSNKEPSASFNKDPSAPLNGEKP